MARYRIEPNRSRVTVVTRPRLSEGPGARVRAVEGTVELVDETLVAGTLTITLDGDPPPSAVVDLATLPSSVEHGPDGEATLHGRADRAAGAFGLTGPPLLNPTLQLRWHLVLVPA